MRSGLAWCCTAALLVACALPNVEVDPALAPGGGASGGQGGTAGAGTSGGTGGTSGSGGAGSDGLGQAGGGDARELACSDYCNTYLANCLDSPANMYTGIDDCLNTCFNSDWPLGPDAAQPNSVQCRVLHAHLARDLPDPHCFHSAKVPTGTSCAL
jgi:hypothetical protein